MPTYLSAKDVIAAVIERYRALQVYSDQGYVITRLPGHDEFICSFQTALGPKGDFRFAFQRPHPYWRLRHKISRHIVGRAHGQAYFASARSGAAMTVETWPDLVIPIAAATGISSGAGHTIGRLLFPEIGGWSLAELKRPRLRSPQWLDGVLCYRVTGLQGRRRMSVFAGMHDLLIRKIAARNGSHEEVRQALDLDTVQPDDFFEVPSRLESEGET